MNKLCRNALASCLAATFAVGGGIAVPAASGASLEQDTAVAGMAVSLDNYYASSQTPEADIMDYIRYIVASAQEKKIIPVFTVNATTKEDGSVVFGTSLVSKDASEKEEGLVSVMASLNVRNKPSVSSNVIGYLYSNCVVSIYDTVDNSEGSWYLIKSGDVEGYVSSDYVLTGAAAKASDEDLTNRYAKVKANTAVVYSSASSGADSVGNVYKDGDYKVLAIQNGFVKIAVNEEFAGFVKAKDVSLYTRHAEAVAITDQMVKNQLDSYLVDIRDAEAIFEKRMAAADYQAAYNASTYAYQLWEYYINDASNAGYADLVTTAKSEQKKTADMVARATAALNGETVAETSTEVPTTTTTVAATSAEETTTSSQAQTSSSEAEETQPDQTESTAPTTVEDTTTTTAEQTTPTTVEDTTTTTAEQTTPTTVEDTTTTTADNTTPSETVKAIQGIEAFYTGSSKTEGQVLSASELYIVVTYTDGTTQTVTEGLSCEQVGMMLSAGWNTVTVSYQGFSSSFDLNVATVEASSETQPSDVPSSETVPDETTTTVEETAPSSEAETTTTVEETVPSSETETTTTTAAETTTTTVEATTTTAAETTTTQEITTPSNNSTPLRDSIVNYALGWVGQCNYVYGGTDLSIGGSVDCSGFTMQVYSRVAGVSLPHHSMSQMNCGSAITYDQLRPGDLVFYNNPNHVAIYIGNGAIVHAGSPETGINITSVFFKTPIGYRTYLP
ncbi:MAG: C40 family peptidase [Lachnospiraceae bacterium]|jgi:cell wall-associated NlpC family hydrolase|uniref:NlpC/P60 family protein n=1 Tax=Anthropogastromicrobium aceti TaxID=2981768 RepID=A0AAE3E1H0_9FIRM|nr:C40 family peptidase [Anthropogastromicrobium aceti]MCC2220040.1 NlpC/P60 family protein [Anthropogastromicrobium aceti]